MDSWNQSTITATVRSQCKNTGCTMIYIKGKKKYKQKTKKKKDKVANQNGTIDERWKTPYEQCKNTVEKRAQIYDWEKIKIKNKKSDEQYILNKSKVL